MKCVCLICNKEFKAINGMHLRTHSISPDEYLILYPDATLYPEEIRSKISKGHIGKKVVRTKPMSEQARKNISMARTGKKYGPSSEAKKAKQRQNWADNYEARCKSVKDGFTPERIEQCRQRQIKMIAERGYHLARGKETRLERVVREYYEALGFEVKKQKQTKDAVLGSKRYFDIYVQKLNTVVEVDGEFWHCKEDRLLIDEAKEEQALKEGYIFIRISDSQLKRGKEEQMLSGLLTLSLDEIKINNAEILAKRRLKLSATSQVQV